MDTDWRQVRLACAVVVGAVLFVIAMIAWRGRKALVPTILTTSVFLVLASVVIPSYFPARNVAYLNQCINNRRAIQQAKQEWAEKNHKSLADIPTAEDLYGSHGTNSLIRELICPAGGIYTIVAVGQNFDVQPLRRRTPQETPRDTPEIQFLSVVRIRQAVSVEAP